MREICNPMIHVNCSHYAPLDRYYVTGPVVRMPEEHIAEGMRYIAGVEAGRIRRILEQQQ
jgi:hypothetical protein